MPSRDHRTRVLLFCFVFYWFTVQDHYVDYLHLNKEPARFWPFLLPFMSEAASYRWLFEVDCLANACDFLFSPSSLLYSFVLSGKPLYLLDVNTASDFFF